MSYSVLLRLSTLSLLFSAALLSQGKATERVLIRTPKPYSRVVANIQSQGGKVTYQYKYLNAIAAEIPQDKIAGLLAAGGITSLSKDLMVDLPSSVDVNRGRPMAAPARTDIVAASMDQLTAQQIAGTAAQPSGYIVNNTLMGLDSLFASGHIGQGIVVALIDSGIRPGFPHISGSVIGGEDLVGDGLGFSNFANGGHGTFVSGMIAAHVSLGFPSASSLVQAVNRYAPRRRYSPCQGEHDLYPDDRHGALSKHLRLARVRPNRGRAELPHHRRHGTRRGTA